MAAERFELDIALKKPMIDNRETTHLSKGPGGLIQNISNSNTGQTRDYIPVTNYVENSMEIPDMSGAPIV